MLKDASAILNISYIEVAFTTLVLNCSPISLYGKNLEFFPQIFPVVYSIKKKLKFSYDVKFQR